MDISLQFTRAHNLTHPGGDKFWSRVAFTV